MKPTNDLSRRQSALSLVGGFLLFFAPQILSSGIPFRRDALLLHLPIRQFIHESLRAGALPHWYPYEGLGVPFIGQIVTATFHPQTLLFLPFSAPLALKLNTLFAYLFGAIGAYKFARGFSASRVASLTGAAVLAGGGYALSMSDNLPYLVGLMTLPWVGWAAHRVVMRQRARDVSLLGVAWALVFLSGDAQSFAIAPLLLLAVAIAGRATLKPYLLIGASGVLAAMLIAVELLPAMSVYSESARFAGQSIIDFGSFWALHPARILEFVTPGFLPAAERMEIGRALFGHPFVWSMSIFLGGISLPLAGAAISKRSRAGVVLGGLVLVAAWLALGSRGGLLSVLTTLLPPLGMFRFPEKYLALFWVGLVPLIALGWDAVRADARRWSVIALVSGVVVAAMLLVLPLVEGSLRLALPWRMGFITTATFLLLTAALLWTDRLASWVPVLLVLELWNGNSRHFTLVSPELVRESSNPVAAAVRQDPSRGLAPPRIVNVANPSAIRDDTREAFESWVEASTTLLRPNVAGLAHVSVMGHSALPAFGGRTRLLFGANGARDEQFSSLLGACYRTAGASPKLREGDRVELSAVEQGMTLIHQPCRPQAYLAQLASVESAEAAFSAVSAGLAPSQAVWERGPVTSSAEGSVQWLEWWPGRTRVLVEASAETGVVFSQSIAPGWQADVDGKRAEIFPTNVISMGVAVPKGQHTVTLQYRTPRLVLGMAVSAVGLLIAGLLMVVRRRSNENTGEVPESAPAGV